VAIYNANGEVSLRTVINSKQQTIDISRLLPGLYFVLGKQESGDLIKIKFIKH